MLNMKRVLMIAYYFPPVGGIGVAGSQRILKFAKYLPSYGWEPIVLSVKEHSYESYLATDPSLLAKVPGGIPVIRTGVIRWMTHLLELKGKLRSAPIQPQSPQASSTDAPQGSARSAGRGRYQQIKDTITDLFEIPDEEMGWILPATVAGLRVYLQQGYDAIVSTGRPWSAHVIGVLLRTLTGKPFIADFRDPWMTNPFRLPYSAVRDRAEAALELQTIQRADAIAANTYELQEEFVKRFPRLPAEKFLTLLNGYDQDDFAESPVPSLSMSVERPFTVVHTGFLYGRRDPKRVLDAVCQLRDQGRIDPTRVEIQLMGSIELPYDLSEYLRSRRLAEMVKVLPHMPYSQSLGYLRRSHIQLLLQPGTKTQVPSKLFDYIGVGRPILTVSPLDGATANLIRRNGLGLVADPDDVGAIADSLAQLYEQWLAGTLPDQLEESVRQKFDVRLVTGVLASKLGSLTAS
jgi:glycosyltransferase involved in cell wall biosynthesis